MCRARNTAMTRKTCSLPLLTQYTLLFFPLSLFSFYGRLHIIIYIQLHRSICIYICPTQCTSSLVYISSICIYVYIQTDIVHKTYSRLINCTTHSLIRSLIDLFSCAHLFKPRIHVEIAWQTMMMMKMQFTLFLSSFFKFKKDTLFFFSLLLRLLRLFCYYFFFFFSDLA